jgi:hypothetical protein
LCIAASALKGDGKKETSTIAIAIKGMAQRFLITKDFGVRVARA